MFYDAQGRPDPNGDYQIINGTLCVRDGRSVHMNIMLMDSAPGGATITDAEKAYAVAAAKAKHEMSHGYLPASERPTFTADHESAAIVAAKARKAGGQQKSSLAAETASLRSVASAVRAARKYVVSNAWRR